MPNEQKTIPETSKPNPVLARFLLFTISYRFKNRFTGGPEAP
jgi:hypothetical protein